MSDGHSHSHDHAGHSHGGNDHSHGGSHGHSHGGHSHGGFGHHHGASGRVGFAFFLNLTFALIELGGGFFTNSMAVMSDALHDFGDAFALGVAWYLERKSRGSGDAEFTYGYRRLSVVSAFLTGVILMTGSIWIVASSVPRLFNPQPVHTTGMFLLALLGIGVNGLAFFRLSGGKSMHEQMLRWHFIEDLAGWVLVFVGSLVMKVVDWPWLDPLMALLVSMWVLWNVFKHLRQTVAVFMQASPSHLRGGQAEDWIRTLSRVQGVHHTHIWSMDGESHILTTHVVVPVQLTLAEAHELKVEIKEGLRERFAIAEATVEFESANEPCVDPLHPTE